MAITRLQKLGCIVVKRYLDCYNGRMRRYFTAVALLGVGAFLWLSFTQLRKSNTEGRQQTRMIPYEYDNGQGTVFSMKFYENAEVIPAVNRKMGFDEKNPPKGSIIKKKSSDVGLVFAIGKLNEIDDSVRQYCSDVRRNIFMYTSKKSKAKVPVCLFGGNESSSEHAFYFTQVESEKGRHIVQIFKDFDSNITNEEAQKALSQKIDLRTDSEDISRILESIEEKRQ